jgi:hypothetical protein
MLIIDFRLYLLAFHRTVVQAPPNSFKLTPRIVAAILLLHKLAQLEDPHQCLFHP